MATQGRRVLSLALISSASTMKTWSDQPRITVWFRSMILDRPRLSRASRVSSPVVRMLIKALTMKMPPRVTRNINNR